MTALGEVDWWAADIDIEELAVRGLRQFDCLKEEEEELGLLSRFLETFLLSSPLASLASILMCEAEAEAS